MEKKELIAQVYKILLLCEDVIDDSSSIQEKDYLGYLNRIYVYWLGANRDDIFNIVKGLYTLGINATHDIVKQMVFHIIDIIQKGVDGVVI